MPAESNGLFIVFEGPEGSGKSTQAARLADWFEEQGAATVRTREPGGTLLGEAVRHLVLDRQDYAMLAQTEALLHTAARAEHVGMVILPALRTGKVVICDRFVDSTLAYQGGGRGLDLDHLRAAQNLAVGGLAPDLRILLDLPVADGLRRRADGGGWNRMDAAGAAFHDRVRQTYLDLAASEPEGWRVVNATGDRNAVAMATIDAVATFPGTVRWFSNRAAPER